MARKLSATVEAPGHKPYRAYFQEDGDMVLVWTAGKAWIGFKTARFGDTLNRDWVRALFADHDTGTKVRF